MSTWHYTHSPLVVAELAVTDTLRKGRGKVTPRAARPKIRLQPSGQSGALVDGSLCVEFGGQLGAADQVHLHPGRT
ncbi:hypothetical protein SKPI104516_03740 [Skermania piniformis]